MLEPLVQILNGRSLCEVSKMRCFVFKKKRALFPIVWSNLDETIQSPTPGRAKLQRMEAACWWPWGKWLKTMVDR